MESKFWFACFNGILRSTPNLTWRRQKFNPPGHRPLFLACQIALYQTVGNHGPSMLTAKDWHTCVWPVNPQLRARQGRISIQLASHSRNEQRSWPCTSDSLQFHQRCQVVGRSRKSSSNDTPHSDTLVCLLLPCCRRRRLTAD